MKRLRPAAAAMALVLVVTACSSSDDAVPSGETTTTVAITPTETTATQPPTGSGPSPSSERTDLAAEYDLAMIEQFTAVSGGGRRPILEWARADGAERYYVVVTAPSGRVYWAWRTSDTSVPVGGHPRLNEDAAGPAVSDGMTWSVVAFDADGSIVGISDARPIAP